MWSWDGGRQVLSERVDADADDDADAMKSAISGGV